MKLGFQPESQSHTKKTREGFHHSLHILDGINSWHVGSSVLALLLLSGLAGLLSLPLLPAHPSPLQDHDARLLVRGLLGAMWVATALTLYRQRRRLKLLRTDLIEQTDAATKHRVRGEQFYGLSILDPLTGLFNRRHGEIRLQEEIERAPDADAPLLLVALDFDKFKHINDTYGHAAGDLALKEFSRRLQRALRACDVPIRVGGDEFLVILPECPPDMVDTIFSRMGSIELSLDGKDVPVRFSRGMAQYQLQDTPEAMIQRADERLYEQKAKRKAADQASAKKATALTEKSAAPSASQQLAIVRPGRVRRSARIPREIAVFLIGSDLSGKVFLEQTNTIEVSQHGAGVVSRHKLAPEQEIVVRRQDTNQEVEVRVVRVVGSESDSYTYGLAFMASNVKLWDVECPPLTESEQKALLSLFECSGCEGREMVDDVDRASSGSAVNEVMLFCKRCQSATHWKRLFYADSQHESPVEASVAS